MIPDNLTGKELTKFLVENKDKLISMKRAQIKHADAISCNVVSTSQTQKAVTATDAIKVIAIINTTNWLDSHGDVHVKGIWNKTLQENKNVLHLQEHDMKFDKIIADGNDLNVSVKEMAWLSLGYNFTGSTEALTFESTVKSGRNKFMFEQYKNGIVKNHSVGMQYVKMLLAVNDPDYVAEYEAWNKYYPDVANKETADSAGYFWVIKEAKLIEGSAVVIGSNTATPTLQVDSLKGNQDNKSAELPLDQIKSELVKMFKI